MATITTWSGTIADIGPMYPFVGDEKVMVVGIFVFWIVWHILQIRAEQREFEEDLERLRKGDAIKQALDREG